MRDTTEGYICHTEVSLPLRLVIPVVLAVTFACRLVQTVAPSNVLIARVRATRPTLLRAGGVAVLALVLGTVAHGLATAFAGGALVG